MKYSRLSVKIATKQRRTNSDNRDPYCLIKHLSTEINKYFDNRRVQHINDSAYFFHDLEYIIKNYRGFVEARIHAFP